MDLEPLIVTATQCVFSTMLMLDLEPEPVENAGEVALAGGITGMLGFSGDLSGMLSLHCPAQVATGITGGFLGMEVEEINADVKDAIGEMVNMLTGSLKEGLAHVGHDIRLAIPTTIVGRSFRISSQSAENRICIPFSLPEGRFFVEVKYKRTT
ncbi:chemotaxis protein CheX [Geoalkalibacter halelectricus]|uniref:Chemotaxis protein CheX n=1 Tax=Geoalkalibacter halelectricus TaxID=2847045 RepID=A0ABY5ZH06_9BACT|nr:chemotaxis protein CheX [Geoalkalibacter halelectricus]MDO3378095.1 chemotaxis protein CheX [Geoalkalibacter halelectricus]UWZ78391.1 chemotaxis protein CheX [Geoalkalibacter halelectricus]